MDSRRRALDSDEPQDPRQFAKWLLAQDFGPSVVAARLVEQRQLPAIEAEAIVKELAGADVRVGGNGIFELVIGFAGLALCAGLFLYLFTYEHIFEVTDRADEIYGDELNWEGRLFIIGGTLFLGSLGMIFRGMFRRSAVENGTGTPESPRPPRA